MDSEAHRPQCGFLHRFPKHGMGRNCACNILILQPCAHLDRVAERRRRLGTPCRNLHDALPLQRGGGEIIPLLNQQGPNGFEQSI